MHGQSGGNVESFWAIFTFVRTFIVMHTHMCPQIMLFCECPATLLTLERLVAKVEVVPMLFSVVLVDKGLGTQVTGELLLRVDSLVPSEVPLRLKSSETQITLEAPGRFGNVSNFW